MTLPRRHRTHALPVSLLLPLPPLPASNLLVTSVLLFASRQHDKNVDLLRLAWLVSRALGAGRIVMCKSAKDRTSMSVTLEQAMFLQELHGLRHEPGVACTKTPPYAGAMAMMRMHGVRRQNALKNTLKVCCAAG